MTANIAPRPETAEDLPGYRTEPIQIARIALEGDVAGTGLLSAVDTVVDALNTIHQDVQVSVQTDEITVRRPRTDHELFSALGQAQREWDDRKLRQDAADQRAGLRIGDALELGHVALSCRECSLHYSHLGDHFTVEDDVVTAIKPRN